MQKITTCLWFDGNAEEALRHYTSIFEDARITRANYRDAQDPEKRTLLAASFELAGQSFTALNGGAPSSFSEAISLIVHCGTQTEIDYYWAELAQGGTPDRCGWLRDRFGVAWQIVPRVLPELLGDPDLERAQRAMHAMLQMSKLDVDALRRAADGEDLARTS